MIDHLTAGPWEPHHYGTSARHWKTSGVIGRSVMPAGIVRECGSGWMWFCCGFYGESRTRRGAKEFVNRIVDAISGIEIPGDEPETTKPQGPRLI